MINAIIADDSPFFRQVLQDVLEKSGKINVIGSAKNGKEAIALVEKLSADVLILDCEMPVMDGITALKHIMQHFPLPIFIFSAFTSEGAQTTIQALEHGAIDFLQKPSRGAHELEEISEDLIKKLENVVKNNNYKFAKTQNTNDISDKKELPSLDIYKKNVDIIAIGSSTGGIAAAAEIVKRLPEKTKPIVWVQHMPPNFTKPFADRINSLSKITIKEAEDGDILQNDHCYIAKGGLQMRVENKNDNFFLNISDPEKTSGHCPSCDILFDSISEFYTNNVLGVILTGMGEDGSKGLLKMHNNGAFIIGQSESSCVVYGMPKAARLIGAVDIEVDICDIAEAIVKNGGSY